MEERDLAHEAAMREYNLEQLRQDFWDEVEHSVSGLSDDDYEDGVIHLYGAW
jgi:hypothetical protein